MKKIKREWYDVFVDKTQPVYKTIENFYFLYSDLMDNKTKEKFKKMLEYRDSIWKLIIVLFDKDLESANIYRRVKFKIKLILHRV